MTAFAALRSLVALRPAAANLRVTAAASALLVLAACGSDPEPAAKPDTAAADTTAADAQTDAEQDTAADTTADTATNNDPASWPVGPAGPFACGLRIVEVSYNQPGGLGERKIPLYVWYPASEAVGNNPTYEIFPDPNTFVDAPLAAPVHNGKYPVVVHSHGHQGFAGNSAFMWCHMASHGWVSLVPDHVGNRLLDTPNPRPLEVWLQRPLDMKRALDWAEELPASDPLAGKLGLAQVGTSGHSYGTYTAWALAGAPIDQADLGAKCQKDPPKWPDCSTALVGGFPANFKDPRIVTAVAMAGDGGDIFVPGGFNAVTMPVLQMNGSLDNAGQAELYADVTGVDLTWVKVENGCHQLYGLGNAYLGSPDCKKLPDQDGFAIVRAHYLAWMRYHVLGDRTPAVVDIVTGKNKVSDLVTWQHKQPN